MFTLGLSSRVAAVRNDALKKTPRRTNGSCLRQRQEGKLYYEKNVKGNEVSSPTSINELLVTDNELVEHELIAAEIEIEN